MPEVSRALTRLLDRRALIDTIRSDDLGFMKAEHLLVFFVLAEAVLIPEDHPSERLEELLGYVTANSLQAQQDSSAKFAEWVRTRARRPD